MGDHRRLGHHRRTPTFHHHRRRTRLARPCPASRAPPARRASPSSGPPLQRPPRCGLREPLMVLAYVAGKAVSAYDIPNASIIGNRPHRDRGAGTAVAAIPAPYPRPAGGLGRHHQARPRRGLGRGVRESCRPGSPDRGVSRPDRLVRGVGGGQRPAPHDVLVIARHRQAPPPVILPIPARSLPQ